MLRTFKNIVERNTPLAALARRRRIRRLKDKYSRWKQAGSVLPMPHFGKQEAVREYAENFKQGCRFDHDNIETNKPKATHAGIEIFRLKKLR